MTWNLLVLSSGSGVVSSLGGSAMGSSALGGSALAGGFGFLTGF